jgi:hypothetical protein
MTVSDGRATRAVKRQRRGKVRESVLNRTMILNIFL